MEEEGIMSEKLAIYGGPKAKTTPNGLVKGASKGEGLGNKFLSNIRSTDAIVHVVRCFDDPNITHVEGSTDPLRDIEIINLELIMADIEMVERRGLSVSFPSLLLQAAIVNNIAAARMIANNLFMFLPPKLRIIHKARALLHTND